MLSTTSLNRSNMSTDIANRLRDMIFDRVLEEGTRLNEVHLASSLGVSRTPLREALAALVAEGAAYSIPRRGVFVRELTIAEFEDIYPIRSYLDPEALRLSGVPSDDGFARLTQISKRMRAVGMSKERMTLDDAWHLELISNCRNQVLIQLIKTFMSRFRRYGLAFLADGKVIETANAEHQAIVKSLRAGNMDDACVWLRRNLTSNKKPILEWLTKRRRST